VAVTDTGAGISEQQLTQIFRPFYTTRAMGTGLACLWRAASSKEHHGRINVTSSVGQGQPVRGPASLQRSPAPAGVPEATGVI